MKNIIKRWLGIDELEDRVKGVACLATTNVGATEYRCVLRKYHDGPHKRFNGLRYNKKTGKFGKAYPEVEF